MVVYIVVRLVYMSCSVIISGLVIICLTLSMIPVSVDVCCVSSVLENCFKSGSGCDGC